MVYTISTRNNISQGKCFIFSSHKEIIRLDIWEEYVGILRDVKICEGVIFLEFDECFILLHEKLDIEKYIGERIGILRTDLATSYLLRTVDKENPRHSIKKLSHGGEIRGMDND